MSFILHFYVFNTCCEPTTAQRLMEKIVAGLQLEIFVIYLEDVNILGKTFEDIIKNPIPIFDRLLEADLKLKARKCTLFATELDMPYRIEGMQQTQPKYKNSKDSRNPVISVKYVLSLFFVNITDA